ncbi:hypothetical protein ACFVUN_19300 [Kitasatospora griseola]|uniref:hypothetical protein n=1 Tax=Kitasatospora griseola TaxID=2064 RepID=UPI0036DC984C
MLRRSTVVRQVTGLGAAVGAVPYLFIGAGIAMSLRHGTGFGLATVGFGLVTGALPGLAAGVSLAASRKGARTRRWPVRASLVAGAVFFLESELVLGLTRGPAFVLLVVFGTPVAMMVAAAAAAVMARKAGEFAWVGPEEYGRYYRLDRARAHRRAGA